MYARLLTEANGLYAEALVCMLSEVGRKFILDEIVKSQKTKKCHAELDSASNKIKGLRDPEASSGRQKRLFTRPSYLILS